MPQQRPLRRNHLVMPFGVGAIIDFPRDESLLVAGLDAWPKAIEPCPDEWKIVEERLQERLDVEHLRWPPEYRERGFGVSYPEQKIPCARFPRWHFCPHCGTMEKLGLFAERRKCAAPMYDKGASCHAINERNRRYLVPLRFVAICQSGHLEDFPLMEWVHCKDDNKTPQPSCRLRFENARGASSVFGMRISCSCGAGSTLAGIFESGALDNIKKCDGLRPWLGEDGERVLPPCACGQPLRVVEKGGSNVYYPHIVSSLYLPRWDESLDRRIVEVLEAEWQFIAEAYAEGELDSYAKHLARRKNLDGETLRAAIEKRLDEEAHKAGSKYEVRDVFQIEEDFRRAEWDALQNEAGGVNQDFAARSVPREEYSPDVARYFSRVVLAEKLRETRALAGFSRWLPDDGRAPDELKKSLALKPDLSWLPAVVARGEGVFLPFDETRLAAWIARPEVMERAEKLLTNFRVSRARRSLPERSLSPRFILLHTFAHLLINAFGRVCGYGASSLRERIYCSCEDSPSPMNGVLIFTASGDCEGSLGGLVRQGKPGRLEPVIRAALHDAAWCSSDPVCIQSDGQGPDCCNLAACHCCALLPETSCEERNQLLDRALVIGAPDNPSCAYFGDW
jgi:hypothetical protein